MKGVNLHMSKFCRFIKFVRCAVCFIVCCLVLCSCQPAPPENAAEELISHSWNVVNKSGESHGKLKFLADNRLSFNSDIGDEEMQIEGVYFADDKNLTVTSNEWGDVVFSYRLENEYLYLTYYEREIKLKKE